MQLRQLPGLTLPRWFCSANRGIESARQPVETGKHPEISPPFDSAYTAGPWGQHRGKALTTPRTFWQKAAFSQTLGTVIRGAAEALVLNMLGWTTPECSISIKARAEGLPQSVEITRSHKPRHLA
jgi:hypothetical protein